MVDLPIHDPLLREFTGFIARSTGLSFDVSRNPDVLRALKSISHDLGFASVRACVQSIIHDPLTPERLAVLARCLTIAETYFYRDPSSLDALATHILPPLIQARRSSLNRTIRAWSAACCTGEEVYSIAIALTRAIPDWQQWDISVLGTDINPFALARAKAGVYGEWSFRSAPPWLKEQYMLPASPNTWEVRPHIKELVRFEQLNLVGDDYPAPASRTTGIDLIFCANVLMYFTDAHAVATVQKFARAQSPAGWLLIGPNDIPSTLPNTYHPVRTGMVTAYHMGPPVPAGVHPTATHAPLPFRPHPIALPKLPLPVAVSAQPTPKPAPVPAAPAPDLGALARTLANQGNLPQALETCDRWLLADKTNSRAHYLRAVVLTEMGNTVPAAASLRKALYLDPQFVMASFTAGNIALSAGHAREAQKHMAHVVRLLQGLPPDDTVPESDGITVQRLTQLATMFLTREATL